MNPQKYWALDTETTGIDFTKDRIIEIALIEIIDRQITGKQYHQYINPDNMKISQEAFNVHGISNEMLKDMPKFSEISSELLDHLNGYGLIIHNATFDLNMLKAEFSRLNIDFNMSIHYNDVIDTLVVSRDKRPGKKHNLDALCNFYNIDKSERTLHGALIDTKLLAEVYLAMTREQDDFLNNDESKSASESKDFTSRFLNLSEEKLAKLIILSADESELQQHQKYLENIKAEIW